MCSAWPPAHARLPPEGQRVTDFAQRTSNRMPLTVDQLLAPRGRLSPPSLDETCRRPTYDYTAASASGCAALVFNYVSLIVAAELQ